MNPGARGILVIVQLLVGKGSGTAEEPGHLPAAHPEQRAEPVEAVEHQADGTEDEHRDEGVGGED